MTIFHLLCVTSLYSDNFPLAAACACCSRALGAEHSNSGALAAARESLPAFSLTVPVIVRLGALFKEVRRDMLAGV